MYIPANPDLKIKNLKLFSKDLKFDHTYINARSALYHYLAANGIGENSHILLPAYLCDTLLLPLKALNCSFGFFDIEKDFTIDWQKAAAKINDRTKAVIIIHYFGIEYDLTELKDLIKGRDIKIIEDCAQSIYLKGEQGAAAVYSLAKMLPVMDGGTLKVNDGTILKKNRPTLFCEPKKLIYYFLSNLETKFSISLRTRLLADNKRRLKYYKKELQNNNFNRRISLLSKVIYSFSNLTKSAQVRRSNYELLVSLIRQNSKISIIAPELKANDVPQVLAVLTDSRNAHLKKLFQNGLNVRTYWDVLPPEVNGFKNAAGISKQILCLPIHEGLSKKQITKMAKIINEVII
jgi:perosamine synthetase